MPGVSQYEALQIASLLMPDPKRPIEPGVGLFLAPAGDDAKLVFESAVLPAMRVNELNRVNVRVVFHDADVLAEVCRCVQSAEVIVVDLADLNPSVMYVLGLAHGLGRCPILLSDQLGELPFNLQALRSIEYRATTNGLFFLRAYLERVLRSFLQAARTTQRPD